MMAPRNETGIPRLTQESEPELQEEREEYKHKRETGEAVAEHRVETVSQHHGRILPDGEQKPRRQRPLFALDICVDQVGYLERPLVAGPKDRNQDSRVVVEAS